MNAINGLLDAWHGVGAAWAAFWGLLSPIGDQITIACVRATPELCVWLDDGWMQIMGYHLLMNGVIFGSVNVWYCWQLYKMDKSVTWYYPNQGSGMLDNHTGTDQPPHANQPTGPKKDNRSFLVRVMNWLGWE